MDVKSKKKYNKINLYECKLRVLVEFYNKRIFIEDCWEGI